MLNTYAQLKPLELSPELTPILYNTRKHDKLTDRYETISTIDPINVLRDHGWQPRQLIKLNTRKESRKGLQAHRVRLFNPELPIVNGSFLELLLTNAYDGSKAFQIQLGIFRMICSNGLVTGDNYSSESVKHIGYANEKIASALHNVIPQAPKIANAIDQWSTINLNPNEQRALAHSTLELRLGEDYNVEDQRAVNGVLSANRYEDRKDDLWTVYNRLQENVIKKGFRAQKTDNSYRTKKVRAVNSMNKQDYLNKALWSLSERMAEIKLAA